MNRRTLYLNLLTLLSCLLSAQIDLFEHPDTTFSKAIRSEIAKYGDKRPCVLLLVTRGRDKVESISGKRDSLIQWHIQNQKQFVQAERLVYAQLLEDEHHKTHLFMYILYASSIDEAKKYFKESNFKIRSNLDKEEWWGPAGLNGIKEIALKQRK
ncbi:MAG: hypothetical protein IPM51_10105 [Sphingobacteriaceae bacterium]|nr:hypothetical protein [Sphingobacteriaceae bacterium]